jgi:nitrous oxidase accessory protein NosD
LRDNNGALLIANDNWQDHPSQAAQLTAHGLAPRDPLESGLFITLPPGAFTAVLAGRNNGIGLGLVEVYIGLQAATLTATSTADSGAGSLRDMIAAAIDGDTIQFAAELSGQAIALTSGEIAIDKNITISGPGPSQLTVQRDKVIGTPLSRIFHVMPDHTVTIEGLTISNGIAESGAGIFTDHATLTVNNCSLENNTASERGGGIFNDGGSSATVTIVNTFFMSNGAFGDELGVRGGGIYNSSGALEILNSGITGNAISSRGGRACGGGIYNDTGTLEVIDSSVGDNYAYSSQPDPHHHSSGSGIGIYNDTNGTLAIRSSTISGNYTEDFPFDGNGGGIYNTGSAEITGSTISGNFPTTNGGGIYNTGRAEITDSTVRQNSTRRTGGGIYNGGTLAITNSTLSDNMAVDERKGYGGGLVNGGALTILDSTLSGNHADGGGGGIQNNGPLMITNSTLSDNFSYPNALDSGGSIRNSGDGVLQIENTILNAGSVDLIFNNSATVVSHGYNLCSDNGGGFLNSSGDQINTDPMLGPLQDNGGPTFTHRLLTGSPAIDLGDPNFTSPPFYDQRGPGYDRVYNGRIDIGSFELQPAPPRPGPGH